MTRKNNFFEGWSWFMFNNLRLALGMILKFYTSLSKGLILTVRKFCGLIPTFAPHPSPPILNRFNITALVIQNLILYILAYFCSMNCFSFTDKGYTECFCPVIYASSEFTLWVCLNVKEVLAQSRRNIWR